MEGDADLYYKQCHCFHKKMPFILMSTAKIYIQLFKSDEYLHIKIPFVIYDPKLQIPNWQITAACEQPLI